MLAQASEIFGFRLPCDYYTTILSQKESPAHKKAPGLLVFSYKLGFHSWRPASAALYRFDQISS